jgi:DNA polymerase (family X)
MNNNQICHVLERIGLLLELKGENSFKIQAYYRASHIISVLPFSLENTDDQEKLPTIPGIGDALEKKIQELLRTGELEYLKNLESEIPPIMIEMLRIPGLGPKKVRSLVTALGIDSIGELEYAAKENRLLLLKGFGEKTQNLILDGIQLIRSFGNRALFPDAKSQAEGLINNLKSLGINETKIAGSIRRCLEIIDSIEIIVLAKENEKEHFLNLIDINLPAEEKFFEGGRSISFRVKDGLPAKIYIVEKSEFPTFLNSHTGSAEHVSTLCSQAEKCGYTLSESGLFEKGIRVPLEKEGDLYKKLGMQFIPPELRENTGEIEASLKNTLPELIDLKDIKGIFHIHTSFSDGYNTVEEMALAAKDMGFEYIGISDHSMSAGYAGGLSIEKVKKQWEEIEKFNACKRGIRVFKGIECEILLDGSLDYPDTVLDGFDFVIASVHSKLKMKKEEAALRILRALSHPSVTMLGHPTGRLLLAREGYPLDMDEILDACAEHGVIVELNSDPNRLDIDWRNLRGATPRGIPVSINPDAHSAYAISQIKYGVDIARKGWLSKNDVLNTLPLPEVEKAIRKGK